MKKISTTHKLLSIHAICHLMLIPAFIYGELWMLILSFIWWQFIAASAISAGYHRYFSHGSFEAPSWYRYYVQVLGMFANPGPVLTWASTHRMHHAYTDTNKDPHSPTLKGFFKVYTSQWGNDVTIERKMIKGLITPDTKFFHDNYFLLITLIAILLLFINPMLFLFGFCMPVVFAFHGYGLVNLIPHTENGNPKNSWVANILTAGEGWHKNHHEDSRNWRIGKTLWQWDPGAWFIKLIKR